MPAASIMSFAKKTGKSEKEIEKLWDQAKKITIEELGVSEADFDKDGSKGYKYAVGVLKNSLGIKESTEKNRNNSFLESDKTAKEFLNEEYFDNMNMMEPMPMECPIEDEEEDEYEYEIEEIPYEETMVSGSFNGTLPQNPIVPKKRKEKKIDDIE